MTRPPRIFKELDLSPREKRAHGVIVTARNQATGQLRSLHEPGTVTAALTVVCATLNEWGEDWRIATICTPRSIYRDLQGSRDRQRFWGVTTAESKEGTNVDDPRPEMASLGKIGQLHMLEKLRRSAP